MVLPSPARRFVLFTFLFSWSCWFLAGLLRHRAVYVKGLGQNLDFPLYHLFFWAAVLGPGIIAVLLSREEEDSTGVWARLTKWRVGVHWYLLGMFLPVGLTFSASLAHHMSSGFPRLGWHPQGWFIHALVNLVLAPFWEELGWRGYLLPKLLQAGSPMRASMILGVIWGLWHLPLRLEEWGSLGSPLFSFLYVLAFCVNVVGLSVIFTWVFVRSREALLPVILLHATFNASVNSYVRLNPTVDGIGLMLWFTATVWAAALLVWRLGGLESAKDSGVAAVQPT